MKQIWPHLLLCATILALLLTACASPSMASHLPTLPPEPTVTDVPLESADPAAGAQGAGPADLGWVREHRKATRYPNEAQEEP